MKQQSYQFIGCDTPWEEAELVLFGAAFDSTTSFRPGARFGPGAIRSESFGIETWSPYQNRDLADLPVLDIGDPELPFGRPEPALDLIEETAATILDGGKIPVMLGGEHLVTLGVIRALAAREPDLHILHFDAHADLRRDYLGEPLSHACVLRRCHDLLGDGRIFQFGIRSGDREEFDFAASGHVFQEKFTCGKFVETARALSGKPVYITIDLDVLDPSVFPGTGTPEAGGLAYHALQGCIEQMSFLDVRGFDLCELSPNMDHSGISTATACKVLREMLISVASSLEPKKYR